MALCRCLQLALDRCLQPLSFQDIASSGCTCSGAGFEKRGKAGTVGLEAVAFFFTVCSAMVSIEACRIGVETGRVFQLRDYWRACVQGFRVSVHGVDMC